MARATSNTCPTATTPDNNVHSITDHVTPANNQTFTYDRIDQHHLRDRRLRHGRASPTTAIPTAMTVRRVNYTITRLPATAMKKWDGSSITYTSTGNITGIGLHACTYNKANQMATADRLRQPPAPTPMTPSGSRLESQDRHGRPSRSRYTILTATS